MKITSGEYEVFESGFVNSNKLNSIDFHLQDDPKMDVSIAMVETPDSDQSSINLSVDSASKLIITYTNPGLVFNFGSSDPMRIGTMQGRKLYAIFRMSVYGTPAASYSLSYTFMLGEPTDEK